MRSLQLAGLPVVNIDLGRQLGTVRSVLLDPEVRRVTALLVIMSQGWRRKGLLRIEDVYAIGDRAVTIQGNTELLLPEQEEDGLWARWRERVDLHGMPILTEDGRGIGSVAAFDFDLHGQITQLAVRQGFVQRLTQPPWILPGGVLRAFGEHAVIVDARALEALMPATKEASPPPPVTQDDAPPPSEAGETGDGLLARLKRLVTSRGEGATESAADDAPSGTPSPSDDASPPLGSTPPPPSERREADGLKP